VVGVAIKEALDELYGVTPDQFIAKRKELVAALKALPDPETASAVSQSRKPTVAAWIVNSLSLQDPTVAEQLYGLGNRLRAAQEALDADELRTLSNERHRLISEISRRALALTGRRNASVTLHDEVRATFNAAVADPHIARHLGHLARAEEWSGFGFGPDSGPQLTLVLGGRDGEAALAAPPRPAPPKETAAQRRRRQRIVSAAQDEFDQADANVAELQQTLAGQEKRVALLERELYPGPGRPRLRQDAPGAGTNRLEPDEEAAPAGAPSPRPRPARRQWLTQRIAADGATLSR
jgi:hypothetical protein